ncbi:MAG TPA: PKD domain-containing protein [Anaerolineae bacterium]|nr:PKD domain-containing protein [Anaerolineae bacterium]
MKRSFTVTSSIVLGLFFLMVIAATQAVSAQQPPADHGAGSRAPTRVQHTQPITPGAPADIVLLLDQSESQSYDFAALPEPYHSHCSQSLLNDIYTCVNGGTLTDGTSVIGCNNETVSDPNFPELTRGICQPFRQSKEAAYRFVKQLRLNMDRIALVTFAENGSIDLPMTFGMSEAITALNTLDVYVNPANASQPNPTGHILCNTATPLADVWKCGSSNIGEGVVRAYDEFQITSPDRPKAQWVALLIVDGPANRGSVNGALPWSDPQYGLCPLSERTTATKCRDGDANSRHLISPNPAATLFPGDPLYDVDDFARDKGDLAGLDPELYQNSWLGDIRFFSIGLGKTTVCLTGNYTPPSNGQPATCTNSIPAYGDPDAGEQLLRYIADMGDDGNLSTGPCLDTQAPFRDFDTRTDPSGRSDDVGLGLNCGNYYFAPDATALPTITLDIATRIIGDNTLLPEFSAAPLSGIAPLTVTFDNLSTGPYTSTVWAFGDGNTATVISPTHVYTDPGVYTVTLTIANITTTSTLTRSNYIAVSAPQWWIYLPIVQKSS